MIEADMRDIEAPSNPDRPSTRFLIGGDESPTSSASSALGASYFDGSCGPFCDQVPHARVHRVLEERRKRPTRVPEPPADLCRTSWSSLTAEDIVSAPFDPSHRKGSMQSMSSKCSQTTYNSSNPFYPPTRADSSAYAECIPGQVGQEARARKRVREERSDIDPVLLGNLKLWLKRGCPAFSLPDLPPRNPNLAIERASEEAFYRKRSRERARLPMREFVDENGTSVQVGFDSIRGPLPPLTKREFEDMRHMSSCVRRISVEGLDTLEPIDETEPLATPPSTVPSQMKRQQVRRQLKNAGYPQNQRANPKRSQSSHVLMLRKNNREPQAPTTRHPQPERRITLAKTREEAENAIESEEEEAIEIVSKGKRAEPTEAIEDDGNEEFTDVEEDDDDAKEAQPASATRLTATRLMAGDFTPEGRARHDLEKNRQKNRQKTRSKSRASQRTLVEHHPKIVSNKETIPITFHYKPTKIINAQGVVESYKA